MADYWEKIGKDHKNGNVKNGYSLRPEIPVPVFSGGHRRPSVHQDTEKGTCFFGRFKVGVLYRLTVRDAIVELCYLVSMGSRFQKGRYLVAVLIYRGRVKITIMGTESSLDLQESVVMDHDVPRGGID